jgi:hypothetical protein
MRHLNAWRDGEDLDPESGISHIAHIATSCNILMDAAVCGTLQDDRNKRPGAGIHGLGFRVYPDIEVGVREVSPAGCDLGASISPVVSHELDDLEAYLDAAGRELLRTESEDSPYADQLRRVFAAEPTTGIDATPGCMTTVGLEDVRPGRCPWVDLIDKTSDFTGVVDDLEAIKDTAVRVVDHDIEPGDKVTGRLVHGENFTGTVANIVDIRGTKLFQFLDRASISEDDIYSITHA